MRKILLLLSLTYFTTSAQASNDMELDGLCDSFSSVNCGGYDRQSLVAAFTRLFDNPKLNFYEQNHESQTGIEHLYKLTESTANAKVTSAQTLHVDLEGDVYLTDIIPEVTHYHIVLTSQTMSSSIPTAALKKFPELLDRMNKGFIYRYQAQSFLYEYTIAGKQYYASSPFTSLPHTSGNIIAVLYRYSHVSGVVLHSNSQMEQ